MSPNQFTLNHAPRTQSSHHARAGSLSVLLVLLLFVLSACTITIPSLPFNTGGADNGAAGSPIDADQLHDFEDALASALLAKEYDALETMSADPFRLGEWQASSRVIERAELLSNLETIYLGPAEAPVLDLSGDMADIEAIVGGDPRVLWGEDLPVLSVLLASGLNEDGAGEALLAIASNAETGNPEWVGMLLAPEGFPASPAAEEESADDEMTESPSALSTITILTSVQVFAAPNTSATVVGVLSAERVVEVLGRSADTDYLRIACPESVAEQCWIENDSDTFAVAEVTVAPTATLANTATPVAVATATQLERIEFVGGPVSQTRTGTVSADGSVSYLVHLGVGQGFTVDLVSAGNVANFSVTGASNGQPYKAMEDPARLWSFVVPVTQDHIVTVFAETESEFILTMLAPPIAQRQPTATPLPTNTPAPTPTEMAQQPAPPQESSPRRIRFGAGETSAQRNDVIRADERHIWVLRVLAGQTLSVDLISGGNLANFAITGVEDGQPYKRLENEDRAFAFVVPSTQDYRITIGALAATNYTLTVVVPASSAPTPSPTPLPPPTVPPAGDAVRLRFATGETRTAVNDIVSAYATDAYVLRALEGQTMYVTIQSPEDIVRVGVQGADGSTLKGFDGAQAWTGVLPATQDYFVFVENPRGVRVSYTLSVGFSALGNAPPPTPTPPIDYAPPAPAQRINFPPSAVSASVDGYIFPGEIQSYVLGARAGQRMEVVITAPLNEVGLSIVGADGTPYKRSAVGTSAFTFILPTTQDYFVEAVALGNASPYTLLVTITD